MAETIIKNLSVTYQFNSNPKPTIATKIVSKDSKTYLKLEMKFPASFFDGSWTRYFTSIQGITAYGLVLNSTIRRETAIETVIDNSNRTMYVYALLSRSDVGKNITGLVETETVNITSQRLWRYQATYDSGLYAQPFSMADSTSIPIESTWFNQSPTLTLTSPANNQTLVEGNTYVIAGTATEADAGNVVTVKYKIDNGSTYNITAAVSDGTTPINFSKTLTYLNNRLYDGQNPVTPILDDNVTHKLTVWAEDDKGGKSADAVRNFTVLYNQPPQISGSDQDLGSIATPPSIQYSVTDAEHYSFTITEKVGGVTIRSFPGTDGQQETLTIPDDIWIALQPDVTHNLTITATDEYGATSTRTYTFKRTVDGIELETRTPLPADAQPYRMVLTLNAQYPQNAVVNVQVCNNGYDENPTWEDATSAVLNGRPYVFTNTTKTALDWGIRIKISILPGA